MIRKFHGLIKKVHQSFSINDESDSNAHYSYTPNTPSQRASPKKRSYRLSIPTDARPNPLAHSPMARRAQPTSNGGEMIHPLSASEFSASFLSVSSHTVAADDGKGRPAPRPQQQARRRTEEASLLPADSAPWSPSLNRRERKLQMGEQRTTPNHAGTAHDVLQYNVLNPAVAEPGPVRNESSGGYDAYAAARVEPNNAASAPPLFTSLHSPLESPPAKFPICVLPSGTYSPTERKGMRDSTDAYDYGAQMSDVYGFMRGNSQGGKSRTTGDYEDVLNLLMTGGDSTVAKQKNSTPENAEAISDGRHDVVQMPSIVAKRQPQYSSLFNVFQVRGRSGRNNSHANNSSSTNNFQCDFSSGNYNGGYSFMNRTLHREAEKSTEAANHQGEGGQNPVKSRETHRTSSIRTAYSFKNDRTEQGEAAAVGLPRADALGHIDSSVSQVEPSTLHRVDELPLSQWKYVALVEKKVAEKRSQLRLSRVKPERRVSFCAAESASFVPQDRNGSVLQVESVVFAPEEKNPEAGSAECDAEDVSVYDDSGEPLLIPNLSDLFEGLQSSNGSGTSAVFESSRNFNKDEAEGVESYPHFSNDAAHTGGLSTPSCPPMRGQQRVCPTAPSNNSNVNGGLHGAMFRCNRQNYAPSPPTAGPTGPQKLHLQQPDHRYRLKVMQQQRERLLARQQQTSQPQPPMPQSYHASPPNGTYQQNGTQSVSNNAHNLGINRITSPTATVGTTAKPWPQPDIRFGPRLTGDRSRFTDITAITGIRLEDARRINSPVWAALEPGRR